MTVKVYSTITNHTSYVQYEQSAGPMVPPVVKRSVVIAGGAGLAKKRSLITPYGVMTEVDDNDWDWLQNDANFKRHQERGFVKVLNKTVDPDKVAEDMTQRDGSAPLVPNDFAATKQPTVGSVGDEMIEREGGTPPTTKPRTKKAL